MEWSRIRSRGRALGDHEPAVHHHQPVAQLLGLVHVVGGQHQRHALLLEPVELLPQDVAGLRVQARGGLVEQQQVGVVDQRAGDGQASLEAAGQAVDLGVALVGELEEREQLVGAGGDDLAGDAEVAAVDEQVLPDRELVVEGVLLRADPSRARTGGAVGHRVAPEHLERAAGGRGDAAIIRMVEDLPAPLGPRKPKASPRCTVTSMPLTASKEPKRLVSPRASTMVAGRSERSPSRRTSVRTSAHRRSAAPG